MKLTLYKKYYIYIQYVQIFNISVYIHVYMWSFCIYLVFLNL